MSMTEPSYALRINALRHSIGASGPLLTLPSLTLPRGGHMAVMGPSGCGKTTLLHLAGGLVSGYSGTIIVHNTPLETLSISARDRFRGEHIGFVFQSHHLLESFTAEENILLGIKFSRAKQPSTPKERTAALLEQVGLSHRARSKPAQLSMGERQRVAIARALAARPSLLLADEPTASLDPHTARTVHQLTLDLCRRENCALLYVTHDASLAADFSASLDASTLLTSSVGAPV